MEELGSLKGALEAIGLFIGTYGLAVFLVVYYAVKLYPELRQERGEWIREITKLRELVDPATRPLTKEQAKTVLLIMSDSFINKFVLLTEGNPFAGESNLFTMGHEQLRGERGEREERISIFNEEFGYFPDRDLDPEERIDELKHIINKIRRVTDSTALTRKHTLIEEIKTYISLVKSETSRLSLLGYGESSLESIWIKVQEDSIESWIADYPNNVLNPVHRYDLEKAKNMLENHPAYSDLQEMIQKELDGIRFGSEQERLRILQRMLERNIEKELSLATNKFDIT